MAPGKVSKMKRVCAASPGKFASALLDILDEPTEDHTSSPAPPVLCPPTPTKTPNKVAVRKRPAAVVQKASVELEPPAKRARTTKAENCKLDEKQLTIARRKELKHVGLAKIKEMALRKGLDADTKDKMIDGIIASEAKGRANVRKHQASIREVVGEKREEFERMKPGELKELLQAYALQTGGTKPERVARLLKTWKEQGEIEKVVAGRAYQARRVELDAMDKCALYELCRKKGVDGLSKDILVDRLLMHESIEIWQEVVEAQR